MKLTEMDWLIINLQLSDLIRLKQYIIMPDDTDEYLFLMTLKRNIRKHTDELEKD